MPTIAAYDRHVEQLFEVVRRLAAALKKAEIPYRIIGGLGVFLHVQEKDPLAARMTRDVDLLVDAQHPRAQSAAHLIFTREKIRPEYAEAAPDLSAPVRSSEGVLIAPVADLVRMKLTSFRLKDQVHIQDMDSVGLITPEIESQFSDVLRERLRRVRESE